MNSTARGFRPSLYVALATLLLMASVVGASASLDAATPLQADDVGEENETDNTSEVDGEQTEGDGDTARSIPGFWLVISLIALLAIGLLVLRRKASGD